MRRNDPKVIGPDDFERAAAALGCEPEAIRAVADVEAPGGGFDPDGIAPKILFEAHWFSRLTARAFDATHPDISSPRYNPALYVGGPAEHKRLQKAVALNRDAALMSASWGRFQIMGFNWRIAGASSLQDFINRMYRSEGAHLDCFVNVIKAMGLADELRDHRWQDFKKVYNGPRPNDYAERIRDAFRKYKGMS
jgi:hypothetical protein